MVRPMWVSLACVHSCATLQLFFPDTLFRWSLFCLSCTVESTGKSVLRADPSIECTLSSGPWVGVFLVACLFALPNILGFPFMARRVLLGGRKSGDFLSERFVRRYGSIFAGEWRVRTWTPGRASSCKPSPRTRLHSSFSIYRTHFH